MKVVYTVIGFLECYFLWDLKGRERQASLNKHYDFDDNRHKFDSASANLFKTDRIGESQNRCEDIMTHCDGNKALVTVCVFFVSIVSF